MPTFIPADRRLVLRYASGGSFNFSKVRTTASNEGLHRLAQAFASIQREQPNKIRTVFTQKLF